MRARFFHARKISLSIPTIKYYRTYNDIILCENTLYLSQARAWLLNIALCPRSRYACVCVCLCVHPRGY